MNRHFLTFFLLIFIPVSSLAQSVNPNGYLYGQVILKGGDQYKGIIRWGKEEASWGDLFHSSKGEVAFKSYIPEDVKEDRKINVFGFKIETKSWNVQIERIFVARFGDIKEIRPTGSERADILMKSGRVYSVEGYSNDVGATLNIKDETMGTVKIDWKKIKKIVFSNGMLPPGDYPKRICGVIETRTETFEGFVQWDHDECLGSDELNGESDDGTFAIPFQKIASIEKRSNLSVVVTLLSDRRLTLRGTNDVNKSNRGIYIDVPDLGRIDIPWRSFKKITFKWSDDTGPNYDQYTKTGPIFARLTDKKGKTSSGYLAYDLDEMEGWEFLNGNLDEAEYAIPFQLIESIQPKGTYSARVILKNGKSLLLEDRADVSSKNLGLLLLKSPEELEGIYTAWDETDKLILK